MQWEHRKIGLGKMEQKYADKYEQKSKSSRMVY